MISADKINERVCVSLKEIRRTRHGWALYPVNLDHKARG